MQSSESSGSTRASLAVPNMPAPARWTVRGGWLYFLQLVSLGWFFGGALVVSAVAPVICWLGGRETGARRLAALFRGYVVWLERAGLFEVRYEGIERLVDLRGAIVAANHPGLLDAVFLIGRIPRAFCIMRASLMRTRAFAGAARWAGYVTNDQGAESIRQCQAKLEAGDNLLIFPEGTRTRLGARGVNGFKSGFALTSVLTGAPIYPVIIERSGSYLGKETGLLEPAEIPIRMSIRVGEAFHPREGETAKELSRRLEDYFREQLVVGRP